MKPSSVLRALCLARNTALVAAYGRGYGGWLVASVSGSRLGCRQREQQAQRIQSTPSDEWFG